MPGSYNLPKQSETATKPAFDPYVVEMVADLVELPISHNMIDRMKTLERLAAAFEAREFRYMSERGQPVSHSSNHQITIHHCIYIIVIIIIIVAIPYLLSWPCR
jgi:hypothetical protein